MKIVSFLLTLVLLSSCTMMERAGIEKRRYRPGFYVAHAGNHSAEAVTSSTQKPVEQAPAQNSPVTLNKDAVPVPPVSEKVHSGTPKENNTSIAQPTLRLKKESMETKQSRSKKKITENKLHVRSNGDGLLLMSILALLLYLGLIYGWLLLLGALFAISILPVIPPLLFALAVMMSGLTIFGIYMLTLTKEERTKKTVIEGLAICLLLVPVCAVAVMLLILFLLLIAAA